MPRKKKTPEEVLADACAQVRASGHPDFTPEVLAEMMAAAKRDNIARAEALLAETAVRPRAGLGGGTLCEIQVCLNGDLPQRLARPLRQRARLGELPDPAGSRARS